MYGVGGSSIKLFDIGIKGEVMLNRRHGITLTDIVGIFAIAIIVGLFMFFAIITSTNTPATVQVPVGSQISIISHRGFVGQRYFCFFRTKGN